MEELVDVAALWNFDDPSGSEMRLRDAAREASGDAANIWTTQVARALGLQERYAEGHSILDALEAGGPPTGETRVRVALERGRLLRSAGEPERSRTFFDRAVQAATEEELAGLQVDALHMLALTEPTSEAQVSANRAALEVCAASHDPAARRWRASLLNNLGCALVDTGEVSEALEVFRDALAERESQGEEQRETQIARWMVGWALRLCGQNEEALGVQRTLKSELLAAGIDDPYVDEEIQLLESGS